MISPVATVNDYVGVFVSGAQMLATAGKQLDVTLSKDNMGFERVTM